MDIFEKIYRRAKKELKRIVLPEGNEPRVVEAACRATELKLARIILLGKKDVISRIAGRKKLDISRLEILDPAKDEKADDYIKSYADLRKHRGIIVRQAKEMLLKQLVYYGAMMLRKGEVDGFVAGAAHTTSDVARACLHCIEKAPGRFTASGSFLVQVEDKQYGEKGLFLFADCGIVPLPRAKQLADIALTSAELWSKITGFQPRLAMLSFSTKGSGSAGSVEKVREACGIVKRANPDLIVDGELQVDSAIVPAVARIKVPDSHLKGRANILIFPSLDAGNIAYKLMQRLARARIVGPLIQGLSSPCSDLSRGCSPQEIVDAIAVTAVRAQ
jgi:phosphate acetyltransferase